MAGKSSALCLAGPANKLSASNFSPSAIATEPILLDVSTANIKGGIVDLMIIDYLLFPTAS